MGKRVARVLLAVVVTGSLLVFAPVSANAQLSTQPFAAYGSGTALAINALTVGATTVADIHTAHSGGSVDSTGLTETLNDQFGQVVQPALPDKNAYGRGAGVEVGLILPNPQPANLNQLILTQVAEAAAPPSTGPDHPRDADRPGGHPRGLAGPWAGAGHLRPRVLPDRAAAHLRQRLRREPLGARRRRRHEP